MCFHFSMRCFLLVGDAISGLGVYVSSRTTYSSGGIIPRPFPFEVIQAIPKSLMSTQSGSLAPHARTQYRVYAHGIMPCMTAYPLKSHTPQPQPQPQQHNAAHTDENKTPCPYPRRLAKTGVDEQADRRHAVLMCGGPT
jgi:hypothetical protein